MDDVFAAPPRASRSLLDAQLTLLPAKPPAKSKPVEPPKSTPPKLVTDPVSESEAEDELVADGQGGSSESEEEDDDDEKESGEEDSEELESGVRAVTDTFRIR